MRPPASIALPLAALVAASAALAGCGGSGDAGGATSASREAASATAAGAGEPLRCSTRYWSKTTYLTLVNEMAEPATLTAGDYRCDQWSSEGGSYPIVLSGELPAGGKRRERLESRYWDTTDARTNVFSLSVDDLGTVRLRVLEAANRNDRWFEILGDDGRWTRCGTPGARASLGGGRVLATLAPCAYDRDANFLATLSLSRPSG